MPSSLAVSLGTTTEPQFTSPLEKPSRPDEKMVPLTGTSSSATEKPTTPRTMATPIRPRDVINREATPSLAPTAPWPGGAPVAIRVGRRLRFRVENLKKWLEENRSEDSRRW